jgi:Tfp pilus assembly protein PilZ
MKATDRYFVENVTCALKGGPPLPVANLSVGGLFAATDRPPMEGQVLALAVSLGDRAAFTVVGQVTWINDPQSPRAPDLPQGFGIRIQQIELPDKLAILDLLRRNRTPSRS